ncbi:hypothetical protein JB92DRAFT_2177140 [Gautieria morchelliformis]|nr:hypothetical protein JB92DRAFT_2177140 [Gautieria morchelliformis]
MASQIWTLPICSTPIRTSQSVPPPFGSNSLSSTSALPNQIPQPFTSTSTCSQIAHIPIHTTTVHFQLYVFHMPIPLLASQFDRPNPLTQPCTSQSVPSKSSHSQWVTRTVQFHISALPRPTPATSKSMSPQSRHPNLAIPSPQHKHSLPTLCLPNLVCPHCSMYSNSPGTSPGAW